MQSQLPILIFAQSARFIAESATRAGYSVRVADCFCDRDTLAVASSSQLLPPLTELSEEALLQALASLSQGDNCLLVCGTGVENFYPAFAKLPVNITLLGNSADTIDQFRNPRRFFSLLDQLGLPHPPISMTSPKSGDWVVKNMHAAGGHHIHKLPQKHTARGDYFQQWIKGQSFSVCFVADGKQAMIEAWNRQVTQTDSCVLATIIQPSLPSQQVQQDIRTALALLVENTGLRGLNSLDFIVDREGHSYLLEVNPRITASAELLAAPEVFQRHIEACHGRLPEPAPVEKVQPIRHLSYLFADTDLKVPEHCRWPQECHDIPAAGIIHKGMPVCTIIVESTSIENCQIACQQIETEVLKNCVITA